MFGVIFFIVYFLIAYAFHNLIAKKLYDKNAKCIDYVFAALMSFVWPIWFVAVIIDIFNDKL